MVQGGRSPIPLQGEEAVSAAWVREQGKRSGTGREVLPFWWQCGVTLAQKVG